MIDICYDKTDEEEKAARICRNCVHFEQFKSTVDPVFNFQKCRCYQSPAFGMYTTEISRCQWFEKKEGR